MTARLTKSALELRTFTELAVGLQTTSHYPCRDGSPGAGPSDSMRSSVAAEVAQVGLCWKGAENPPQNPGEPRMSPSRLPDLLPSGGPDTCRCRQDFRVSTIPGWLVTGITSCWFQALRQGRCGTCRLS